MRASAPLDLDVVLSGEWLTAALGVEVAGPATVVERLETIATKVRFTVRYAGDPGDLPAALCVKGYFGEEGARFASIGVKEARFYDELAARLPVRVPRCVYAAVDSETQHGLVLMEDLVAAGATFLTALSPYTPDQVAATLDELAGLHAVHWDDPELRDATWLDPSFPGYAEIMPDERLEELLSGPRGDPLPAEVKSPARIKAALGALAARLADRPSCLVHCDAHAGNLYEDAEGRPGLVDWQIYQRAGWFLDVAYHVGAVLTPEARRSSERDLVGRYLDCLRARGVEPPDAVEAWDDYRAGLAYGFFMWAITQRVEPAVTIEFNRRLGTAVADHGSFELLGV